MHYDVATSLLLQQQSANTHDDVIAAAAAKCAHPLQLRYGEVSSERSNRRREGREPRAASAVAEGDPPTGRRRRPTDRRRQRN